MAKTKTTKTTKKRLKKTESFEYVAPVVPEKKYLRDDQMQEDIKCSLMKVKKYANIIDSDEEPRLGSYSSGPKRNPLRVRGQFYNVFFNLVVDWEDYQKQGYKDEEIAKRCMKYIFTKRIKKKIKKEIVEVLPFGNVNLTPIYFCFINRNGKKYISIETTTDQRENPLLWGEGVR